MSVFLDYLIESRLGRENTTKEMSSIIYVGFDKSLTIPKFIEIFGKEEPTPDCFTINIGKKELGLSLSGEFHTTRSCGEHSEPT